MRVESAHAAKKAEADRRMALALGRFGTCRSSLASRCASSVVVVGRYPSSTAACLPQFRSVSGLVLGCFPVRATAPDLVAESCRTSTAMRVARSRSSSGFLLSAPTTYVIPWIDSLHRICHGTTRALRRQSKLFAHRGESRGKQLLWSTLSTHIRVTRMSV